MSLKHVVVSYAATMTIALSSALYAQPAPVVEAGTLAGEATAAPITDAEPVTVPVTEAPANAAPTTGGAQPSVPAAGGEATAPQAAAPSAAVQAAAEEAAAAQEYKRRKMDAANAAYDRFNANRTQTNMVARDKAQAQAAAAIEAAHAAQERAIAAKEDAARAGNPQ